MERGQDCDGPRAVLRDILLKNYDVIARRLIRRTGSLDGAYEVLQETYLRLERVNINGPMRSPQSYLFRIALNVANDIRRSENRRLIKSEVDVLLAIPDDRPDQLQITEDRAEIELLKFALAELPERRRNIFMANRIRGVPNSELAKTYGVTVRTIELEVKSALEHCAVRLQRPRK